MARDLRETFTGVQGFHLKIEELGSGLIILMLFLTIAEMVQVTGMNLEWTWGRRVLSAVTALHHWQGDAVPMLQGAKECRKILDTVLEYCIRRHFHVF